MADPKKGRGCFFYGCLTLVAVVVIGLIAIFFSVRYFYKTVITKYTTTKPVAVEPVRLSTKEGDTVVQRIVDFTQSAQKGNAAGPLELSSDELDYYVRTSPSVSMFKDSLHLGITNDQIHAQMSLPLGTMSPALNGRYFNGDATFSIALQGNELIITPSEIEMNGEKVPEKFMQQMRAQQNFRFGKNSNDQATDALVRSLSKIEIKDGKLKLYPK